MTAIPIHTAPRLSAWLISSLAARVLALATGAPLRSVPHLMPHPGEQRGPYLGL